VTIQITQAIIAALYAEVNAVDALLVQEQRFNDLERSERNYHDTARLQRYAARCSKLHDHREKLQAIYIAITEHDPWANIPY
jgi:hypothetical protein